MGRLTTHVLDTAHGVPAAGVAVTLYRSLDGRHALVADAVTNADGRLDLAALSGRRFAVWEQRDDATFPAAPTLLREVPERGIPLFDPSYDVQLVDLEKDGRAEVVLVSGRTEGDVVSTVVEVFRQAQIRQAATFNFTPFLVTAVVFLLLTIPLARFTDWLIGRQRRPGGGPASPSGASARRGRFLGGSGRRSDG